MKKYIKCWVFALGLVLIFGACFSINDSKKIKQIESVIFINDEIAIEKSEKQQFALYHFKYGISESDMKKIEKNDMINGVSKISKSTIHVYKNLFYSWEDINKIIININTDKPLKNVDTKF